MNLPTVGGEYPASCQPSMESFISSFFLYTISELATDRIGNTIGWTECQVLF
ncbi:hypothetical protein GF373_04210 [bacterium]|nr:hypothetical protein [bacterium]